jgi:hypothetical protein
MRNLLFAVLALGLSTATVCGAGGKLGAKTKSVLVVRPAALKLKNGKTNPITVEFALGRRRDEDLSAEVKTRIFGGGGRQRGMATSRVIEALRVTINGRVIEVPPRGLADVTEPKIPESLAITGKRGEFVIAFGGADGEYGYTAEFHGTERGFTKRVVTEPLNPKYQNIVLKFELNQPPAASRCVRKSRAAG